MGVRGVFCRRLDEVSADTQAERQLRRVFTSSSTTARPFSVSRHASRKAIETTRTRKHRSFIDRVSADTQAERQLRPIASVSTQAAVVYGVSRHASRKAIET